ncbi:MAG TPA: serine protease [Candidatus Baltobacteraceae bacterium]|nr:serine protease [Candidatus Baltobacteraceae bacterium]
MHALLLAMLLKAATVIVSGDVGTPQPQDLVLVGVGTGVVVAKLDAQHYAVVTAAHVARYSHPHVAVYGRPHGRFRVEQVILDPSGQDLAMLVVRSKAPLPVVALAPREPKTGARLEVVGHPFARTWRVNHARYAQGTVVPSALLTSLVTRDTNLWICRGCDRGNSGSGIYDAQGRLDAVIYAAAPLPAYRRADARELQSDEYNPHIVRQVLAIDVREVRSLLRYTGRAWRER